MKVTIKWAARTDYLPLTEQVFSSLVCVCVYDCPQGNSQMHWCMSTKLGRCGQGV